MQTTSTTTFPPTPEMTLSAIALRSDAHATVLDRYKLDFCCRGSRSLQEACRGAGLDVDRVLAELTAEATARQEARSAAVDWQDRTPDELIDFIVSTHHDYTRAAFARLAPLVAKVAGKHGDRHPELARVAATFEELAADLGPHMMKEERVLFPYIRALGAPGGAPPAPFGTVRNPVQMMMREHDRAAELLVALAERDGGLLAARGRLRQLPRPVRGAGRAAPRSPEAHLAREQRAVPEGRRARDRQGAASQIGLNALAGST